MCIYCQGLQKKKFIKIASGTYADLYQGYSPVGGWQLRTDMHPCPPYVDCTRNVCYSGKNNSFRMPSLTQNFKINYCPMCGRDLRTENKV